MQNPPQRSPINTRHRSRQAAITPSSVNLDFLNDIHPEDFDPIDSQLSLSPIPQSQTQELLLSSPSQRQPTMDTQISLSGLLNQTMIGTQEMMETLQIDSNTAAHTETPEMDEDARQLKAYLTIIGKASHHKSFMEACLLRNSPPKNMQAWVKPQIYHSNKTIEAKWRKILHHASMNLVACLIPHFASIISETTKELRALETRVKLKYTDQHSRQEWNSRAKDILESANERAQELRDGRETKLSRKRKTRDRHDSEMDTEETAPAATNKKSRIETNTETSDEPSTSKNGQAPLAEGRPKKTLPSQAQKKKQSTTKDLARGKAKGQQHKD